MTTTCTITTTATGGKCGAPAVTTFTGRIGTVYAECAAHAAPGTATPAPAAPAAPAHPRTRTTMPYVLVAGGRIVGYAAAVTPAVRRRAARLAATIVPVVR